MRGQLGPAIAADREQGEALAGCRIRQREQFARRHVEQPGDQRIDQPAAIVDDRLAVVRGEKPPLEGLLMPLKPGAKTLQHRARILRVDGFERGLEGRQEAVDIHEQRRNRVVSGFGEDRCHRRTLGISWLGNQENGASGGSDNHRHGIGRGRPNVQMAHVNK